MKDPHNHDENYKLLTDKHDHKEEDHGIHNHDEVINKQDSPILIENTLKSEETLRKLWVVSGICLVFMVIEIIGGYLASSIAIMSDAAHLLSDFLGFIISIASIYVSRRKATAQMSFGYHRAEVIGAMVSVNIIWGLTIWLLYEATLRMFTNPKVDGLIMLITAVIGFVFNIVMGLILAYQGIDHNLHHHHHDEDEGAHGHVPKPALKRAQTMLHSKKSNEDVGRRGSLDSHSKIQHSTTMNLDKHDGHLHEDEKVKGKNKSDNHEHKHKENEHKHKHRINTSGDQELDVTPTQSPKNNDHPNHAHGFSHNHENVNLRAALIHVIGDAVQNLGVVIAGLIIYFYPEHSIADPICTVIFSIIVVFTTIRILKDCLSVLMEGSPLEFDIEELTKDLYNIRGVEEVHDLHVWSLSVGKISLSCHLISTNPQITLKKASKLCRDKYKINHATIQVEHVSDKLAHDCTHDLH